MPISLTGNARNLPPSAEMARMQGTATLPQTALLSRANSPHPGSETVDVATQPQRFRGLALRGLASAAPSVAVEVESSV